MSYFPDVRTDEVYKDKDLKGWRVDALKGYDWCVEQVDTLFDNLEVYLDVEEILDPDKAVVNVDKVRKVRDAVAHWLEMFRNEWVTSMLDDQFCEEESKEGESND